MFLNTGNRLVEELLVGRGHGRGLGAHILDCLLLKLMSDALSVFNQVIDTQLKILQFERLCHV